MEYSFNKIVEMSFEEAIARTTESLQEQGFGVLTDIDVQATLKKKINVEFRNYRILGACSPTHAYQALQAESRIGTMLPCNVIVQETEAGQVEVSAIDPVVSMQAVGNASLGEVAAEVQHRLKQAVENL